MLNKAALRRCSIIALQFHEFHSDIGSPMAATWSYVFKLFQLEWRMADDKSEICAAQTHLS